MKYLSHLHSIYLQNCQVQGHKALLQFSSQSYLLNNFNCINQMMYANASKTA